MTDATFPAEGPFGPFPSYKLTATEQLQTPARILIQQLAIHGHVSEREGSEPAAYTAQWLVSALLLLLDMNPEYRAGPLPPESRM